MPTSRTQPRVSVLIPCFNAEDYIAAALDSVLDQTCPPFEVIVVDDGSGDSSREIVHGFRHRGVRLIEQQNAGAPAARNAAYLASSGEVVLFLDSDDIICPGHLAALVERITGKDKCISMSEWDRFYQGIHEATFPRRIGYRDDDGVSWLVSDWANARPMTQSGMFLIPRLLLDEVGLWREGLSFNDDFEFFARVISRSDGIRFAPDARLYYRSGLSNSLCAQRGPNSIRCAAAALIIGVQHLLDAEDSPRTRRSAANVLQYFIYDQYPNFPDLRKEMSLRVKELGGATITPDGPPGFHKLRRFTGWRFARRVQGIAERRGWNGVSRRSA